MSHCFYTLVKDQSEAIFAVSHVFPVELNFMLVTHLTGDQTFMCKMCEVLKTNLSFMQDPGRACHTRTETNQLGQFLVG